MCSLLRWIHPSRCGFVRGTHTPSGVAQAAAWIVRDPFGPSSQNPDCTGRLPEFRKGGGARTRQHVAIFIGGSMRHGELDSPFARPLEGRDQPQRRMSPIWESYRATRSRSSLHTEAPTEPLRERLDQSEARQATFGVLQIEAEPLVLHTELV